MSRGGKGMVRDGSDECGEEEERRGEDSEERQTPRRQTT